MVWEVWNSFQNKHFSGTEEQKNEFFLLVNYLGEIISKVNDGRRRRLSFSQQEKFSLIDFGVCYRCGHFIRTELFGIFL